MDDSPDTKNSRCDITHLGDEERSKKAKIRFFIALELRDISEALQALDEPRECLPAVANTHQRSMMRRESMKNRVQPLPGRLHRSSHMLGAPSRSTAVTSTSREKSLQHGQQRKKEKKTKRITSTATSPFPCSTPFLQPSTSNTLYILSPPPASNKTAVQSLPPKQQLQPLCFSMFPSRQPSSLSCAPPLISDSSPSTSSSEPSMSTCDYSASSQMSLSPTSTSPPQFLSQFPPPSLSAFHSYSQYASPDDMRTLWWVNESTTMGVLPYLPPPIIDSYPPPPLPPPPPFVPRHSPSTAVSPTYLTIPAFTSSPGSISSSEGSSVQVLVGKYKNLEDGSNECPICFQSMSRPDVLERHLNSVHSNARSYPCLHPGCEFAFKRKDHRLKHMARRHRYSK